MTQEWLDRGALQRFQEGLRFLESQGWKPVRARAAIQAYEQAPSREHYFAARDALDQALGGFRDVLAKRAAELRSEAFDDGTIQRLVELSRIAGMAMFQKRFSPLDGRGGVLVASSPPS